MPFDFPAGAAPGDIFEPNGAGTGPAYTFTGIGWVYGATTELLISSVIPNAAICGSAALPAVRALGANFTGTCEILIDGTPVATAFVSVSELTFPVNPVPETVPRTAVITVRDGATIGVGAVPFNFRIVTTVEYRIGIDETSPGIVDVLPANTVGELGGVTLQPRSATQGLEYDIATALVTAPLATPLLAGVLTEPPDDSKGYVRQTTGASSTWVPPADTPLPDFGTGLSLDETATPQIVHLQPAGDSPATLGGVYVIDRARNVSEGLELGIDGRLRAPLATDSLAGTLLEPPPDDKGYVRRRDLMGVSAWVPPADPAPPSLAIEFIIPNTVQVGSAPLIIEVHGTKFTAATTVNFGTAQPAVTFIDETELTFEIDPALETVRTLSVTINDSGLPGQGDAPFYFRAQDKLYQGTWQPVTNTPDILTPPKGDKWMWIADTVDPRVPDLVPTTIPGIGGLPIKEGDHVVWDAAAATFSIVASASSLAITEIVPTYAEEGSPVFQAHVFGTGFTPTSIVHFEGVPVPTQYLDATKMRVTVDPSVAPPARGVFVVSVVDGTVIGTGEAGFHLVAPTTVYIAGDNIDQRGTVYVPDARGISLQPDGAISLSPTTPTQIGGIVDAPFSDPADLKSYARQNAAWVEVNAERILVAGDNPGQKGIVYVPDAQGLSLQQDGRLTLSPTTPDQIGGLTDAPFSDPADLKSYARQNAAWVEIDAERVLVAGDNEGQKGIVYVPDAMGLALQQDGRLTLAPTTDSQVGGIIDAPYDSKPYVRQDAAWVETAKAVAWKWGVGLEQRAGTDEWVDLLPSGNQSGGLGGVKVLGRGPTQGLELAVDGTLTAPLATHVAAGAIVDPPNDGKPYSRQRSVAGVSAWVPGAAATSFSASQPFNPLPTDPPLVPDGSVPQHVLLIPPTDLPATAINWLIDLTYMTNKGNGAQAATGSGGIWTVAVEYPFGSGTFIDVTTIGWRSDSFPDANTRVLRGTNLIATTGDSDRVWRYDPATDGGIRLGIRLSTGVSPGVPWNIFIGVLGIIVP